MNRLPLIASRLFNTPLLVHPAKLDAIISSMGERILGAPLDLSGLSGAGMIISARGEPSQNGYTIVDGVAVLEVSGILAHKTRLDMNTCDVILGYQDIARQFDAALADPAVQSILFVFNTPGGEVAGVFDLAAKIFAARGIKPMASVSSDMAASAGYLIKSAVGGTRAVTQTAIDGSIGVVLRHADISGMLEKQGIKVTSIFAGAHKVDGNQFEALPAAVRADMQTSVLKLYEMFAGAVSQYTGMTVDAVKATEAACYTGADAVAAGLATVVATPDEMIQELRVRSSVPASSRAAARATHSNRSLTMSGHEQGSGSADANPEKKYTQADLDRVRSEANAAGIRAGMEQERARVAGIMGHEEAEGRSSVAQTCVTQGLSVEQSAALLKASPRAQQAAATGSEFAAHMAALGNPKVLPDKGTSSAADAETADLNAWLSDIQARQAK